MDEFVHATSDRAVECLGVVMEVGIGDDVLFVNVLHAIHLHEPSHVAHRSFVETEFIRQRMAIHDKGIERVGVGDENQFLPLHEKEMGRPVGERVRLQRAILQTPVLQMCVQFSREAEEHGVSVGGEIA